MKNLKCFGLAILAGAMIGIGGIIYLSVENKVIGAFLFSIGLFFVVSRQFNLFTGKVGYLVNNDANYLGQLIVIWLGNLTGTYIVGNLMRLTRQAGIAEKALSLCEVKINDTITSIFILACFCGVLMYLAVDSYKTIENSAGKNMAVVLSVVVFILCGFEHCIANMFYFSVAGFWSGKVILYLLIMTFGNSVGAVIVAGLKKYLA